MMFCLESTPNAGGHTRNVFVFCRHGSRRSIGLVGSYLMCKAMCRGTQVYEYLEALRAMVEPSTRVLLENVERQEIVASLLISEGRQYHGMPCVISGKQLRGLLEKEKILKIRQYFPTGMAARYPKMLMRTSAIIKV